MRHNEINKKVNEGGLGDLAQMAERDHEVQMARADLYKIAKYAIKLHEMLKTVSEAEGIEGWQQSKITKAADYIGSVYHAMDYDMKFAETAVAEAKKSSYKDGLTAMLESKKKSNKVKEDAPTMTGKQAALKKQQQAALLKSKTTGSGMVDRMNIVGKGMQDKVNKTQADADSLSRAAGVDPNQVNKDIKKSLSGKPKLRDKFRKKTESKDELCKECGKPSWRTFNIDEAEGKEKGLDGKACWKGYRLAGTKKKGDKTVDNCVKM